MNWRLILMLACLGILVGTASLFGLTEGVEPILWALLGFVATIWIGRHRTGSAFWHGFFTAFLMGAFKSLVQSAFFGTYLASNPKAAAGFTQIPGSIPPRGFALLIGFAIAISYGVVVGILSYVADKLFHMRRIGIH